MYLSLSFAVRALLRSPAPSVRFVEAPPLCLCPFPSNTITFTSSDAALLYCVLEKHLEAITIHLDADTDKRLRQSLQVNRAGWMNRNRDTRFRSRCLRSFVLFLCFLLFLVSFSLTARRRQRPR